MTITITHEGQCASFLFFVFTQVEEQYRIRAKMFFSLAFINLKRPLVDHLYCKRLTGRKISELMVPLKIIRLRACIQLLA